MDVKVFVFSVVFLLLASADDVKRDKRTVDLVLKSFADVFGYDVVKRISGMPLKQVATPKPTFFPPPVAPLPSGPYSRIILTLGGAQGAQQAPPAEQPTAAPITSPVQPAGVIPILLTHGHVMPISAVVPIAQSQMMAPAMVQSMAPGLTTAMVSSGGAMMVPGLLPASVAQAVASATAGAPAPVAAQAAPVPVAPLPLSIVPIAPAQTPKAADLPAAPQVTVVAPEIQAAVVPPSPQVQAADPAIQAPFGQVPAVPQPELTNGVVVDQQGPIRWSLFTAPPRLSETIRRTLNFNLNWDKNVQPLAPAITAQLQTTAVQIPSSSGPQTQIQAAQAPLSAPAVVAQAPVGLGPEVQALQPQSAPVSAPQVQPAPVPVPQVQPAPVSAPQFQPAPAVAPQFQPAPAVAPQVQPPPAFSSAPPAPVAPQVDGPALPNQAAKPNAAPQSATPNDYDYANYDSNDQSRNNRNSNVNGYEQQNNRNHQNNINSQPSDEPSPHFKHAIIDFWKTSPWNSNNQEAPRDDDNRRQSYQMEPEQLSKYEEYDIEPVEQIPVAKPENNYRLKVNVPLPEENGYYEKEEFVKEETKSPRKVRKNVSHDNAYGGRQKSTRSPKTKNSSYRRKNAYDLKADRSRRAPVVKADESSQSVIQPETSSKELHNVYKREKTLPWSAPELQPKTEESEMKNYYKKWRGSSDRYGRDVHAQYYTPDSYNTDFSYTIPEPSYNYDDVLKADLSYARQEVPQKAKFYSKQSGKKETLVTSNKESRDI